MTTIFSSAINFIKTIFVHLWLSVTSIKFYERVYKNYKGYGAVYILNLSLISSFLCTIAILYHIDHIRNYLDNDVITSKTQNIDFVISQFPDLDYDGKSISSPSTEPIFIKNIDGTNAVLIDIMQKVKSSEHNKYPVILSKDKVIINYYKPDDIKGNVTYSYNLDLESAFGYKPEIFTSESIKASFAKMFKVMPRVYIYLLFPLGALLIFCYTFIEKSLFIIMLFFVGFILRMNISIKACIRLSMFASGFYALLSTIIIFLDQNYFFIISMIQTWSNILLILGIFGANSKSYFFKKR